MDELLVEVKYWTRNTKKEKICEPVSKRGRRPFEMKLVTVVDDEKIAKLLADPMRRAILNILREAPMTGSQLGRRLGLTDATVNHHVSLLRKARLLVLAKKEREEHGIMQKFYLPSSYLYLADIEILRPEVARYYFPINVERIRGVLSTLQREEGGQAIWIAGRFARRRAC